MAVKESKKEVKEVKEVASPAKKESKKNTILVSIAVFQYMGDDSYTFKDERGVSYVFYKDDVIYIHDGESARYFDYKTSLFKRINNG